VDPVLSGNPVEDIAPRTAVTFRPLVTYLMVFDLTFGFLAAWGLLLICVLLRAPAAADLDRLPGRSPARDHP
jgi:hypothetical protein